MSSPAVVITTTDSDDEAERLARGLVGARLAACVQIVGPVRSVFRWGASEATGDETGASEATGDESGASEATGDRHGASEATGDESGPSVSVEEEYQLVVKTVRVEEVTDWIVANHSYELPEVIALPVVGGHETYLTWVAEESSD